MIWSIPDATFFLPNQGRNAREDYLHSHIPGAHFFDVDTIADHRTNLPHMLPTEDVFATAAGQFGDRGIHHRRGVRQ